MESSLALLTDLDALGKLAKTATSLHQSGLLPKGIKSPQAAMTVMLRGVELGLPPVAALSLIHHYDGKAELPGTVMQAILQRAGIAISTIKSTAEVAEIRMTRTIGGEKVAETYEYTIGEAKTAGLDKKDNWRGYAKDMLYWRAVSRGARRIGADVIHGCYVIGEVSEAPTAMIETEQTTIAHAAIADDSIFPTQKPDYPALIASAVTLDDLRNIGGVIAMEPEEIRIGLRETYEARRSEIQP